MGSETDRLAAELERLPAKEWERLAALLYATHPESITFPPQHEEADNDTAVKVGAGATADRQPAAYAATGSNR